MYNSAIPSSDFKSKKEKEKTKTAENTGMSFGTFISQSEKIQGQ